MSEQSTGTGGATGSAGQGSAAASGLIAEMSREECFEVLAQQRLCVMSMVDGDRPYAVPMFYGFDAAEGSVFIGISEGAKTRILDANPQLCITVAEVGTGDSWKSVVVTGRAAWVTEADHRQRAIRVLMEHNQRAARRRSASTRGAA